MPFASVFKMAVTLLSVMLFVVSVFIFTSPFMIIDLDGLGLALDFVVCLRAAVCVVAVIFVGVVEAAE